MTQADAVQSDIHFVPYLKDSFRETGAGWTLAFEPRDQPLGRLAIDQLPGVSGLRIGKPSHNGS
jgi:hypothetical protein